MAKEFREAKRGEKLGLNDSELVFYDALAENESAVRELGDEILKKIALELTEKLRNSTTVDWQKKGKRPRSITQFGPDYVEGVTSTRRINRTKRSA